MEFVITFFRDVLDGPLYIVVSIICGILFCSCIGYLAENYYNKKRKNAEYMNTHADVSKAVGNSSDVISDVKTSTDVVIPQNTTQVNQNYASTVPLNVTTGNIQNSGSIENNVDSVNNSK